jgi:hypothetical protein
MQSVEHSRPQQEAEECVGIIANAFLAPLCRTVTAKQKMCNKIDIYEDKDLKLVKRLNNKEDQS